MADVTEPEDPVDEAAAQDLDRVLTIPNAITLVRLLLLPYYLYLLFGADARLAAAGLLAILGATDWIDGYVARHFNQASNLGRLMDPTVDRLLFFVGVGGILVAGAAPVWFCVLVLVREVSVAAVTVVLTLRGVEPIRVSWYGKAGTFCLMFAFPWFLAGSADSWFKDEFNVLAWCAGIPGLVLSYYAAITYIPQWREALREHQRVDSSS
jgi:cardiolipin synthase